MCPGVGSERFCIFSANDQQLGRTKKGVGNTQAPNWNEELDFRSLPPGTTSLVITVGSTFVFSPWSDKLGGILQGFLDATGNAQAVLWGYVFAMHVCLYSDPLCNNLWRDWLLD
jgi:hypothetical protein